jgi:hypothetical protein
MRMADRETVIQQNIRLALGKLPSVRMFRNNVGQAITQDGRPIQFGLCKGSSDLIGWKSITVTPEMVGQKVAVFTAIECKAGRNKPTQQQRAFISRVLTDGGIAGVAYSVEDAEAII